MKKTHVSDMVPFAFTGTGIVSNGASAFNEPSAADVGLTIDEGYRLMDALTEGGVG